MASIQELSQHFLSPAQHQDLERKQLFRLFEADAALLTHIKMCEENRHKTSVVLLAGPWWRRGRRLCDACWRTAFPESAAARDRRVRGHTTNDLSRW